MRRGNIVKATVTVFLLIFFLLAGGWPAAAQGETFSGGSGTESDPYQIATVDDLKQIQLQVCTANHHFILMNDLDLNDSEWVPLCQHNFPFKGHFDGNNKTIRNMHFKSGNNSHYGLFRVIQDAVIEDLRLEHVQLDINDIHDAKNNRSAGALAGRAINSTIKNVEASGTIQSSLHYTGGLVGQLANGSQLQDGNGTLAIISTGHHVGGLAGSVDESSSIIGGSFSGSVQGHRVVGGIAGVLEGTASGTESDAAVIGFQTVGGLAGLLDGSSENVTVRGTVYGEGFVGGLAGELIHARVTGTAVQIARLQRTSGFQDTFGKLAGYAIGPHEFEGLNLIQSGMEILDEYGQPLDSASLQGLHAASGGQSLPHDGFAGGDGTENSPYLIETAEQLFSVRYFLDDHFELNNNIDLSSFLADKPEGWLPIGSFLKPFRGHFSGNQFVIHGLSINNQDTYDPQGLFSSIEGAAIEHVHLSGMDLQVRNMAGAMSGHALNANLSGISASGSIRVSETGMSMNMNIEQSAGGLVGKLEGQSELRNAISRVDVTGIRAVGGAIGLTISYTADNPNGVLTISDVKAYGKASGMDRVGGLIGSAMNNTDLQDAIAYGDVYGDSDAGGLIGYYYSGSINQVKSYGSVYGYSNVGGLIGYAGSGAIKNAVAYGEQLVRVSGFATSFGTISGVHLEPSSTEPVTAHPSMLIIDQTTGSSFQGTGYNGMNYSAPADNSAELTDMQLNGQSLDNEGDAWNIHWQEAGSHATLTIKTEDPYARVDSDSPFLRELPFFGNPGEHRFHLDYPDPAHPSITFQIVVVSEDTSVRQTYQVKITRPFDDTAALNHIREKLNLANGTRLTIQHIVIYALSGGPYFLGIPQLDEELLILLLELIEPIHPGS